MTEPMSDEQHDDNQQTAPVEPELTAEQLDALRDAMLRADALEAYRQTWTRSAR